MKSILFLAIFAILLSGPPAAASTSASESPGETEATTEQPADEIRFRVIGLRSDDGTLACGLFEADGWLRTGSNGEGGDIEDGTAVCIFRGVSAGTYGISAYHDENDNGELDSNFMRIPKEGTAASRDARGRFGPPKFKDARFDYAGGVLELKAKMHYR